MSDFNPSYVQARSAILKVVPPGCKAILDVGCATGATSARLKDLDAELHVVGVELDPAMAEVARGSLDEVLLGDVCVLLDEGALSGRRFDCILLADVIEHVADPWSLLGQLVLHLEPGGTVITSLPNVRHISTLLSLLLFKRWPYRDRGIHDRTHLRFFAQRNLEELFGGAGLKVARVKRKLRLIETPHPLNRFAWLFGWPPLRDLITFQYVIVARREE
jgi:2-polyprenyl-3-methyl-5-hydroxy-6-metoxy-1,4-benzoquinol methylase